MLHAGATCTRKTIFSWYFYPLHGSFCWDWVISWIHRWVVRLQCILRCADIASVEEHTARRRQGNCIIIIIIITSSSSNIWCTSWSYVVSQQLDDWLPALRAQRFNDSAARPQQRLSVLSQRRFRRLKTWRGRRGESNLPSSVASIPISGGCSLRPVKKSSVKGVDQNFPSIFHWARLNKTFDWAMNIINQTSPLFFTFPLFQSTALTKNHPYRGEKDKGELNSESGENLNLDKT